MDPLSQFASEQQSAYTSMRTTSMTTTTNQSGGGGGGENQESTNNHSDGETPQPPPPPTSSVFNFSAYDITRDLSAANLEETAAAAGADGTAISQIAGHQEQEPENDNCCELSRVLEEIPAECFLPPYDTTIALRDQKRPHVIIEDASKLQDMAGKTFISYLIHTTLQVSGTVLETRHRYSDFESLRAILVQTYPYISVPPIPEKHSVVDYASKPGKAQQDPQIIAKRKRLLQSFLNRVLAHSVLRKAHQVHLFLRGEGVWTDVVANAGLKKKPIIMLDNNARLHKPDAHFIAAQEYTNRFGNQIAFIRKTHKKMVSQYREIATVYMELGALYNGWSLTEQALSESIEQMGQAIDSTLTATTILHTALEEKFGDFLSEYNKYTNVLQSILNYRHRAHVEFEQTSEKLIYKQQALNKLETSEHESQRLAAVLANEGGPQIPINRPSGIMAQINALIDSDPDTTRRVTISKTKDQIAQLEVNREERRVSLLALNTKIQRDLDRFQKQKIKDLKAGLTVLCLAHREYHVRALAAWKEAKDAIERIEA